MIEFYLRELEGEGITAIPRWTPPSTGTLVPVSRAKEAGELLSSSPDGQWGVGGGGGVEACHVSILSLLAPTDRTEIMPVFQKSEASAVLGGWGWGVT